jgi:hypothetical protein
MTKTTSRQEKTIQEKPFIGPNAATPGSAQEGLSWKTGNQAGQPSYTARKGVWHANMTS